MIQPNQVPQYNVYAPGQPEPVEGFSSIRAAQQFLIDEGGSGGGGWRIETVMVSPE